MARFTALETHPDAETIAAERWLRERLEAERRTRGLAVGLEWSIQRGKRDAGPQGGPRLAQTGFRIEILNPSAGANCSLPCFIATDDIQDEEQRGVVEQVLGLWLDRALDEGQ